MPSPACEHELVQRFSLPERHVTLPKRIRQFGKVGFVSDGYGCPRLEMLRYLVKLPRLVGRMPIICE